MKLVVRSGPLGRRPTVFFRWAAAGGALAALACCPGPERRDGPPTILLIVVDALRPDSLGCYGCLRPTSPVLDRLATESVRFTRAYSVSPWTKPSIPALLTSLYPLQHGVHEGNAHVQGGLLESDLLPAEAFTVAEALRSCGYRTAAFVHNAHLRAAFGLTQGFNVYDEASVAAPEMVRRVLDWLKSAGASARGPRFVYVHLLDTHWPYEPTAQSARLMGVEGRAPSDRGDLRKDVNRGLVQLSPEAVAQMVRRYEAEVRDVDTALGNLFEGLRRTGLWNNAVVVVTSDHGEEFLEHGQLGHGGNLYEESIRIPLLLRMPRGEGAGSVVKDRVTTLDLMPTLLDLAGCAPTDAPRLEGRSLVARIGGRDLEERPVHWEVRHGTTRRQAISRDGWKLIRVVDGEPREDAVEGRRIEDPDSLRGLRVEIEGRREGDRFLASEIELDESDDSDDEVTGIVESVDPKRRVARLLGFDVDLKEARLTGGNRKPVGFEAVRPGRFVKVEGEALGPRELEADELHVLDGKDKVEIEGRIRRVLNIADESVNLDVATLHVSVGRRELEKALRRSGEDALPDRREPQPRIRIELYDLVSDPGETTDLSSRESTRVRSLIQALEVLEADLAARALERPNRAVLDEETAAKLRGLGYVH